MTYSQANSLSIGESRKEYILAVYLFCATVLFAVCLIDSYTFIPLITPIYPFIRLVITLLLGGWIAAIVHTAFFCIWCAPVFTGENRVPIRSSIALVGMTFCTVIHYIKNWEFRFGYGGEEFVTFMAWVNGGFIFVLAILWLWARKKGGITLYFLFHFLMFVWFTFAFLPYPFFYI